MVNTHGLTGHGSGGMSWLLVEQGDNPSSDYFVKPWLAGESVRCFPLSEPLNLPAPEPGTHVVFVRYLTPQWRRWVDRHRASLGRLVFFMDDDLLDASVHRGLPLRYRWKLHRLARRHESWLRRMNAELWVSSQYLADKYPAWQPKVLMPHSPYAESVPQKTFFYHGSSSHMAEIRWLVPVVEAVLERDPALSFELIGNTEIRRMFSHLPRVHVLQPMRWSAYKALVSRPGRLVGLAPLLPDTFNQARSPTKFFDITRAGAAGLYADHPVYRSIVCHGENGLLLPMEKDAWVEAILELSGDTSKREAIHQAALQSSGAAFEKSQPSRGAQGFDDQWSAFGFSKWKRRFIPGFLGPHATVRFVERPRELPRSGQWLVWSSQVTPDLESQASEQGAALWRMEDGFIRSVGLGVDLVPPLSLVLDSRGIYYDATRASDLEWMLQNETFEKELLARARRLRAALVESGVTKYNVGQKSAPLELPSGRRVLLVPGQVETDASIRFGAPQWRTNAELLRQVRERHPDAFIVYKPHPDVLAGGRVGMAEIEEAAAYADRVVSRVSMSQLLGQVDEVHTLTSLTGFEALLRGVSVTTYGLPFYAGWGLSIDQLHCERRSRRLTLDELVAATLILYPRYIDPRTGESVTPEQAVALLSQNLGRVQGPSLITRSARVFRRLTGRLR